MKGVRPGYPLFRSVCPGWDNTARRRERATIFANASPAGFQEWLEQVCRDTLRHFEGEHRLVFVNAWNEWAEGAYLEPNRRTGYAYLNATAKALQNIALAQPSRPPRAAVIAHVYYEELWPEISARLRTWDIAFDLYVTTTCEQAQRIGDLVKASWPDAVVASFPNRGRDMASFLQQAKLAVEGGAELICKVHTKRSAHRTDGEQWRRSLYGNVLGDGKLARQILRAFAVNSAIGIIAPEGHVVPGDLYWGSNAARVLALAARLGYQGDPTPFVFSAGSMFWIRSEALRPMLDLDLTYADFEEEARQVDGTLAHALERLFPIVARMGGYRLVDTRIIRTHGLRSVREQAAFMRDTAQYAYARTCSGTSHTHKR